MQRLCRGMALFLEMRPVTTTLLQVFKHYLTIELLAKTRPTALKRFFATPGAATIQPAVFKRSTTTQPRVFRRFIAAQPQRATRLTALKHCIATRLAIATQPPVFKCSGSTRPVRTIRSTVFKRFLTQLPAIIRPPVLNPFLGTQRATSTR
jgi:hypothetical protein